MPCKGGTVMRRLVRKIKQNQQGITGLETAIILIAFVIVASVFAYVVPSAGLFSTQKAKEAVRSGLQETRSAMELKGNALGKMEDSVLTEVYFTVDTPPAGDAIDLFQITVDLSCVSANATDEQKPGPCHQFQLEVKPPLALCSSLSGLFPPG